MLAGDVLLYWGIGWAVTWLFLDVTLTKSVTPRGVLLLFYCWPFVLFAAVALMAVILFRRSP